MGLVQSVPGISLTTLARRVGLETSSANWHLRKLADAGLVSGERHSTHRIFFAASTPPPVRDAARAAHCLDSDTARAVLETVVDGALVPTRRVAEDVGLDLAQARHQLNRLRRNGLLDRIESSQGHLHRPSGLAAGALDLARAYEEEALAAWLDDEPDPSPEVAGARAGSARVTPAAAPAPRTAPPAAPPR